MPSPRPLERRSTRVAMRLSVIEGAFYAVMFGLAELYFVPDAIRMGASPVVVGLMVGFPLATGALGAALGLQLLRIAGTRRRVVVAGVSCQALVLLATAWMQWTGLGTIATLLASVCIYHFFGQLLGPSWSSWFGDLVPAPIRGRYFSHRTRTVHLTSFVALLAGGGVLQWLEPPTAAGAGGLGFAVLYTVAGIARAVSAAMLAATPEGRRSHDERTMPVELRPHWHREGDRLILLSGLLFFAVYLGSPFFTPYMLEDLGFSYLEYTLASAVVVLCKVLSMPRWGRVLDRHGAAALYRLAILLTALVPLPWLVFTDPISIAIAQGLSGFAWAAHEVAFFSLVLETHGPRERPRAYTLQSIAQGGGQLLGSLAGGVALGGWGDPRWVFGLTTVARLGAALATAMLLRELYAHITVGRRALLLRVIGFRPSGGAIHRPILAPQVGERESDEDSPAAPS